MSSSSITYQGGEKKPVVQSTHMNIKVKGQDGNEVSFRIKRTSKFEILMKEYCNQMSLDIKSIAFIVEGRYFIKPFQTPEQLNMEDGDEIDAMLHQNGGAFI
ncbi:E3 ubiquitin-protein ligase parkin [Trema orientale]|uniref:Small ubiquitin-related modifier n=1 Tax=Trema orientale TaxID=63057 RepID=A0A2P5F286_TREOI|nr:E3 ubiquitin-protein ligase parkin [Trema orientale]